MGYERMVILADLFSDESLGGWAIPNERMPEFVSALKKAARDVGGIPFEDIDFGDFDASLTSFLETRFRMEKEAVIAEAESLMRSDE